MEYVSLHNHSSYSPLLALSSPKELFARAKELGQKAIAISDYGTMASAWDGYELAKETGLKFIVGRECYFTEDTANPEKKLRYLVLLAMNAEGYRNLLLLHRESFDHSILIMKKIIPVIDWKLLEKYQEGLICLTACGNGIVGQLLNSNQLDAAEKTLLRLKGIFGDRLGAEIQAHNLNTNATDYRGKVNQIFTNQHIIRLAKKHQIRIVPTSNTHYTLKEDADAHDTELAIGSMRPVYSNNRMKFDVSDFYLKSGDEVKAFFARNYGEDFAAEICQNTVYFADRCENSNWINPQFATPGRKELPVFPVQDQPDFSQFQEWLTNQKEEWKTLDQDKSYLRYCCEKSFQEMVPKESQQIYRARLEEEIDTFYYCGVSSYLLITADFINWARSNEITVGFGRGSGAGSLVGYLLGIHLVDPIKYGLVFERFFSKLRNDFADIDTDISQNGREKVIQYIIKKYGKENVGQITNIVTMKPKVYVKDLARSHQLGGDTKQAVFIGQSAADCLSADTKNVDDGVKQSAIFAEYSKRYPEFLKYKKICNKTRTYGVHAGAIVISSRPLASIVPVRKDRDGSLVIEFDKDRAEKAGLIKMDVLGVKTYDIVDLTNQLIREQGKEIPKVDLHGFNEKTYDLISKGETSCVFQLGTSAGTIDLCRKIKPQSIEDLATINTLARPQAREIRANYIKARSGKHKVKLLHPSLERAMKDHYGFSIYDESLLVLSSDVAGWTLAEADQLRKLTKAKGKYPEKARKARESFIGDAIKRGVDEQAAIKIWEEIIEPFGSYSFNKSHSVCYSVLGYQTAYLKAHYPLEFLLANLKFELQANTPTAAEDAANIKNEIRKLGKKILAPDINLSDISYKIEDQETLRTGFEGIKFLGDDAMEDIIAKRPFISFDDFMLRIDPKKVKAPAIQALTASGALDRFKIPRKLIFLYSADYKKKLQVWKKKHDPSKEKFEYGYPEMNEWSVQELYALEYKYMSEAFIGGKKEAYPGFFNQPSIPIKAILKMPNKEFLSSVRGEIKSIFEFKVKKETSKNVGQDMMKAVLEADNGEQISITFFPDGLKEAQKRIKEMVGTKYKLDVGLAIQFNGAVNVYNDDTGIIVRELMDICPPPQLPKDLKVKKTSKKPSTTSKLDDATPKELQENIEEAIEEITDDLFNLGYIDLEDDEDNDNDD
jgi:DNA polymerase III subunit alpha